MPTTFEDDEYNKNTIEIGNAFLTKDEAQFELERRKVVAKIKRWKYENDGDYKFTAKGYNYCIGYDCDDKELYVDWRFTSKDDSNYLYFNSEETATECLKFIGEKNWKKYILEIE